jgi:hypothetical protein
LAFEPEGASIGADEIELLLIGAEGDAMTSLPVIASD